MEEKHLYSKQDHVFKMCVTTNQLKTKKKLCVALAGLSNIAKFV